jgi:ABC-2 type transport system ATP-binding protein
MIEVKQLTKNYGDHQALKGIDFNIKSGEFYGLLGPNGAGKTTTISILSSILPPDSGAVTIKGINLHQEHIACKKLIGVVPQEIALYEDLTAWDNLLFWGSLYGVNAKELKNKATELLKMFGLYDRRNEKVGQYSGGMKRRINIASALLHSPEILFMDEPTVGIDPQSRNNIYEAVEQLNSAGMTIIYTTHYMEEAERFCDRIGIIDHGEIIAQGTLDELKKTAGAKESVVIQCEQLTDELQQQLKNTFGENISIKSKSITIFSSNIKTELGHMLSQCFSIGIVVEQIEVKKVNLESIFLSLTGKKLRD